MERMGLSLAGWEHGLSRALEPVLGVEGSYSLDEAGAGAGGGKLTGCPSLREAGGPRSQDPGSRRAREAWRAGSHEATRGAGSADTCSLGPWSWLPDGLWQVGKVLATIHPPGLQIIQGGVGRAGGGESAKVSQEARDG